MRLLPITITGIDAKTDLTKLPKDCEIGVLYTETPEGRNRYPTVPEILNIVRYLFENDYQIALHVCGKSARNAILTHNIPYITFMVDRIQINGFVDVETVERICKLYPHHDVITQHTASNYHLLNVEAPNHSLLIDGSGGNGITPESWVIPFTNKSVGFAGGLSPSNIQQEFDRIKPIAKEGFWLDMEGKLRNEQDWFSVDLANQVANVARGIFKTKEFKDESL